jgi:hypothetical protein
MLAGIAMLGFLLVFLLAFVSDFPAPERARQ